MEKNTMDNSDSEDNAEEIKSVEGSSQSIAPEKSLVDDLNNKYLRLYSDFDNYKKRVNKDKEELLKYGNESLLYELLPIIDNLELALKHAEGNSSEGIVQGVEMTLKELHRTLEKFGLSKIESYGKPFDPSIHHAMSQVERNDMDEKSVAEELRAGYLYRDKVLRPSLVAVSIKPLSKSCSHKKSRKNESEGIENKPNERIEEEQ